LFFYLTKVANFYPPVGLESQHFLLIPIGRGLSKKNNWGRGLSKKIIEDTS
ncbi:hypothetical protein ACJX0J_036780, partial [Zea mays]